MIANIIRIQKKIAQLINENPENTALDDLAQFVNKMSPYEITDAGGSVTYIRNKKTLKVIDL